ncbi:hypothetical protein [[Micrococcus luteus] ATCC 49442]|uniref:hypothetical protein n=1 Tax=[Micrococcus luteus] ATCC 49442 TaxID=2698727 RepID=UPI0013DD1892|nr:hypothetical protein [[Micrococcus luteus] ATCC 49442]
MSTQAIAQSGVEVVTELIELFRLRWTYFPLADPSTGLLLDLSVPENHPQYAVPLQLVEKTLPGAGRCW